EAETTERVMRVIFADASRFVVHAPLPGGTQLADEGAANHTRLFVADRPAVHLFAWGRSAFGEASSSVRRFPARQTREASEAVARLHQPAPERVLCARQHPQGIEAGAFHTDVLAVGTGAFLMLHEMAFSEAESALESLRSLLGESFRVQVATAA